MKVATFILPAYSHVPSGGFKVVFEHANRLVRSGEFQVNIAISSFHDMRRGLRTVLGLLFRYVVLSVTHNYDPRKWFRLDEEVQVLWVFDFTMSRLPLSDIYIATAIDTAEPLARMKAQVGARKAYFIQDFEDWDGTAERVYATYKLPLEKVVISSWLLEKVRAVGEEAILIRNGFDPGSFFQEIPPQDRSRSKVLILNHRASFKRVVDALAAIAIVKDVQPELEVTLFGVPDRPSGLPSWIEYIQRPPATQLRELYNTHSIFVGASEREGWGLTIGEAMLCGCAVACTDNSGYLTMAVPNVTALVSPVRDPALLAKNILRLIQDDSLRLSLGRAARAHVQSLDWETPSNEFIAFLSGKKFS